MCATIYKLLCALLIAAEISQVYSDDENINKKFTHHIKRKKRYTEEHNRRMDRGKYSCVHQTGRDNLEYLSRHPRDIHRVKRAKSKFGKAIYFSGKQVLKLARVHRYLDLSVIKESFTAELWIQPEGGQYNPVNIIEMVDSCSSYGIAKGWSVGIGTVRSDGEQNARIFFSLQTGRSSQRTNIYDYKSFVPRTWVHVAVSFNGSEMALYVNNAKIAVSHKQTGPIFPLVKQSCKTLRLGGVAGTRQYFRGTLDELNIWSIPLSHRQITAMSNRPSPDNIVLKDSFDDVKQWTFTEGRSIDIVSSDIPIHPEIKLTTPMCGQTVCDDPKVVISYANNWQLRTKKQLRYRIVNLMNDDGSHPTVKNEQIQRQHEALNNAFRSYNISFQLDVISIKNTSLNQRLIMFGCDPLDIGNGQCNPECQNTRTGNDGGDCDPVDVACDSQKVGNGRCDYECNRHNHQWDGGDCCIPGRNSTHYTCYDPFSPWRGYMSIIELKEILQIDSTSHLNVFFVAWTTDKLIGVATFPWEKHVFTIQGGTVVQPETFGIPGQMDSLVHEIGHNLGLWHVHHGVSEVKCGDPCEETSPSMVHGDMCADTLPTPKNQACHDPMPLEDTCGTLTTYKNTPFRNFMSYADDNCTSEFTAHQTARMHCYLDLVYQPWRTDGTSAPVPVPPRIASSQDDRITLVWIPPLRSPVVNMDTVCSMCTPDNALIQNAVNATSPAPTDRWSPEQATGPPDAEMCDSSIFAWMPKVYSCTKKNCQIDLFFQYPVIPERLTIWVIWNAAIGIKKLRLYFEGGRSKTMKNLPAHCDMPFTTRLSVSRKITKLRIYTRDQYVAIDAVEVLSSRNNEICSGCRKLKYKIHREPPFPGKHIQISSDPHFTDYDVKYGVTYRYWVDASSGGKTSQSSPGLYYKHGQPYCGNGQINMENGELCDDGNVLDGDGCNTDCQIEDTFQCLGSPSLCYRHDGDGVCEEFERMTSIKDCGYYTPDGYIDQQVFSATSNPEYKHPHCPETAVIGYPDVDLICNGIFDPMKAWHPCGSFTDEGDFWLEVFFAHHVVATEVIVHIASDGRITHDSTIIVELLRIDGDTVTLSPRQHTISCSSNPLHIPVIHDLSKPFFYTKGVRISFTSFNISISAVRLRSSKYLDPITIASCTTEELYNTRSGLCVSQNTSLSPCVEYQLEHGTTSCSGLSDGDVCTVTCQDGYSSRSIKNDLICSDGKWLNSTPVSCEPIDCGRPSIPHANINCRTGTQLSSTCTFTCIPPAKYQGTSNTVHCDINGLWTTPKASCVKQCPVPVNLINAKLTSRKCKRRPMPIGAKCKYRCYKGYHVQNERNKKRSLLRTCGDTGDWEGPVCERVICPAIDNLYKDLYTCTDGLYAESVCTLRCLDKKRLQVIKCMKNGQWDGRFKVCALHKVRSCLRPLAVNLDFHCTQLVVGASCRVRCKQSTHEPVVKGNSQIVKPVTEHTPREASVHIVCLASRSWYPSPTDLVCERKCIQQRRGDGWCDGQNNRAYCGWDDGDCCGSTVKGDVLPYYTYCKEECTCKDPHAIENISKSKFSRDTIHVVRQKKDKSL